MRKIIIICLVFLLYGCQDQKTIHPPQNLRFEGTRLLWDSIEDATQYTVKMNDQTFVVTVPEFDYSTLPSGEYIFYIKVHTSKGESSYTSSGVTLIYMKTPPPMNIRVENDLLYFDATEGAQSYDIYFDEALYINVLQSPIPIPVLPKNEVYMITIKSVFGVNVSVASKPFYYFNFDEPLEKNSTSTNQNGLNPFYITLPNANPVEYVVIDGNIVSHMFYTQTLNHLYISRLFISSLDQDDVDIQVYQGNLRTDYELSLFRDTVPYLATPSSIQYQSADVQIQFELFGATVNQLSATGLTSEDYTIHAGVVTIKQSYIDRIKAQMPTSKNIVLTYELLHQGDSLLGIIMIKL